MSEWGEKSWWQKKEVKEQMISILKCNVLAHNYIHIKWQVSRQKCLLYSLVLWSPSLILLSWALVWAFSLKSVCCSFIFLSSSAYFKFEIQAHVHLKIVLSVYMWRALFYCSITVSTLERCKSVTLRGKKIKWLHKMVCWYKLTFLYRIVN